MEEVFDTLKDVRITLEGIVKGSFDLDKNGYDISEIWDKLTKGEIALDMYLENEYHQRHTKGRFIKRLIVALNEAQDLINAALDGDSKEVYHDWLAVAKLCEGWIKEIDDCYKNIPYRAEDFPPGSIARSYLANLERMEHRDMMVPQEPAAPRHAKKQTEAYKKLNSPEVQEIVDRLIQAGIMIDGKLVCGPAEFECLVKELGKNKEDGGLGIQTDKGTLARKECALFFGFAGNLESARSSTHNDQQTPIANEIKTICREVYAKYVK